MTIIPFSGVIKTANIVAHKTTSYIGHYITSRLLKPGG